MKDYCSQVCERCNKETQVFKMSMFNTQMCCLDCIKIEKRHPEYENAKKIEREHTLNGDSNFPGIGLPVNYDEFTKNL